MKLFGKHLCRLAATCFGIMFASCVNAGPAPSRDSSGEKLRTIVIPAISFRNASLADALDYLQFDSRRNDPSAKGVKIINMTRMYPEKEPLGTITLSLEDKTVYELLQAICNQAKVSFRPESNGVVVYAGISPPAGLEADVFRRYQVFPEQILSTVNTTNSPDAITAAYAAVMAYVFSNGISERIVLAADTCTYSVEESSRFDKFSDEVWADFIAKSNKSVRLDGIPMTGQLVYLEKAELAKLFPPVGPCDWDSFGQRYGRDVDLLEVSQVGLNNEETEAIVLGVCTSPKRAGRWVRVFYLCRLERTWIVVLTEEPLPLIRYD